MDTKTARILGVALAGLLLIGALAPLAGQDKKDPRAPAKLSGFLMKYTDKNGSINHITVLQPTPRGKVLQQIHELAVTKDTKFIIMDGDDKTELDPRTVLTDDKTKEMLVQKPGSTLGNNSGVPVQVEFKGKAVVSVTITQKKKD
jgi:hypothetical protein